MLGLEVSRLARHSTDWHRLLEICVLTDALILDEDGVYDPAHFNDRLLLGLKGTMSEAELHVLRARLQGGILNKARRAPRRVSVNGGTQPRWRQDGEELFYVEGNTPMAVAGLASGSLTVLAPVKLCSAWSLGPGDAGYRCYDVTPDGEQFLLCESDAEQLGGQLVQNWFAEFKDQQAAP